MFPGWEDGPRHTGHQEDQSGTCQTASARGIQKILQGQSWAWPAISNCKYAFLMSV